MFKRFLVPLDGSALAEAALPPAGYLAQRFQASVTLLHLIEHNAPEQVHGEPHLHDEQEAETYLKRVAERSFAPEIAVDYHVHTSEISDVARSITAHADEFANDLIILCAHGRGGVRDWMFGSIAQQVVARDTKPVLLVPAHTAPVPASFRCDRILVPLNDAPDHTEALPPATRLAQACAAAVHLLMVVPTAQTLSAASSSVQRLLPLTTLALLELTEQQAVDFLAVQVERLRRDGLNVTSATYRGDPAAVIIEVASKEHADLIVLATHGRTGFDAFWEQSVAPKVSSRSQIPLLLTHIREDETDRPG